MTLVAYAADTPTKAYIDHLPVGESLPDLPVFLTPDQYIDVPMEQSYLAAFNGMPEFWRNVLENESSPA